MRKDMGISLRQNGPFRQVPPVLHTVPSESLFICVRGYVCCIRLEKHLVTFTVIPKGVGDPRKAEAARGRVPPLSISSFPSQIKHGGNWGFPGILQSLPPPLAPGRQLIMAQEDERCPGKLESSGQSGTPGGRECRGRDRGSCRCNI